MGTVILKIKSEPPHVGCYDFELAVAGELHFRLNHAVPMPHIPRVNAWSELEKRDPVMRKLIQAFGVLKLRKRHKTTTFGALSRMIVGQQLSSKAAATIFGRYEKIIPGADIHD